MYNVRAISDNNSVISIVYYGFEMPKAGKYNKTKETPDGHNNYCDFFDKESFDKDMAKWENAKIIAKVKNEYQEEIKNIIYVYYFRDVFPSGEIRPTIGQLSEYHEKLSNEGISISVHNNDDFKDTLVSEPNIITVNTYENNTNKYRVGKKQGRAILEVETGHEYLVFPVGKEEDCKLFCDWLNNFHNNKNVDKPTFNSDIDLHNIKNSIEHYLFSAYTVGQENKTTTPERNFSDWNDRNKVVESMANEFYKILVHEIKRSFYAGTNVVFRNKR